VAFEQLTPGGVADGPERRDLSEREQAAGVCWYRWRTGPGDEPLCPFAQAVVRQRRLKAPAPASPGTEQAERETLATQLDAIYQACGHPATHRRR
jgi:hypothetical protein